MARRPGSAGDVEKSQEEADRATRGRRGIGGCVPRASARLESCGVTTISPNGGVVPSAMILKVFWSGRPDSNRRRPAWENATTSCTEHHRVSRASPKSTPFPHLPAEPRRMESQRSHGSCSRLSGFSLSMTISRGLRACQTTAAANCSSVQAQVVERYGRKGHRCLREQSFPGKLRVYQARAAIIIA